MPKKNNLGLSFNFENWTLEQYQASLDEDLDGTTNN